MNCTSRGIFVRVLICLSFLFSFSSVFQPHTDALAQAADQGFNPNAGGEVTTVLIEDTGNILVGGYFSTMGGYPRVSLARLDQNGDLDQDFAPGAVNARADAVALQPDGRIVVGGEFTTIGGIARPNLARLDPSGQVDLAFPTTRGPNGGIVGTVRAVAVQLDGKIVIGGDFTSLVDSHGATVERAYLARINPDGTIDLTYPTASATVRAIRVLPDGRTFLAGSFGTLSCEGVTYTRRRIGIINMDGSVGPALAEVVNGHVTSAAQQADGKLIIGGSFTSLVSNGITYTRNNLARLNQDGSVDAAFTAGTSTANKHEVRSLTVQPTGRIIVGGIFTTLAGGARSNLGRLMADGSLDSSFNTGTVSDSSFSGAVNSVAVQPDGKVVVGGSFGRIGGVLRNNLARLNLDGSVETGFTTTTGGGRAEAIAVQHDQYILLGGSFTSLNSQARSHLGRLNPNGSLDASFDPGANGAVSALLIQADRKIVVGGSFTTLAGAARSRLGRLNLNGSLDAGFDPAPDGPVYALLAQADGKLLVGGDFSTLAGAARSGLGRLNADGSLDAGFNPGVTGVVRSLAVQDDGSILVGGSFTHLGGQPRPNLGRLNPDGSLDEIFNPAPNEAVWTIFYQPDQKILLGGDFTEIAGAAALRLARLNPNGSLAGSLPSANGRVTSLAVQENGKVHVGGHFTQLGSVYQPYLALVTAGGAVDASFTPLVPQAVSGLALESDGKLIIAGDALQSPFQPYLLRIMSEPASSDFYFDETGQTLYWMRGGGDPLLRRAFFEVSINGGSFTSLGQAVRVPGGWMLENLDLPGHTNLTLRAAGFYPSGASNASRSAVESVEAAYLRDRSYASLASSPHPSDPGQEVTLSAVITGTTGLPGAPAFPTGVVAFYDGAALLGTRMLAAGAAELTTSFSQRGPHLLRVEYLGDTTFAASSAALTHRVRQELTSTSLVSTPNPTVYGGTVTFTALVTSSAGTPAGTVTFFNGSQTLGSQLLDESGRAIWATSALNAGEHPITASYLGSDVYEASVSEVYTQTVQQAAPELTLASSPNPSTYGETVVFTATAASAAGTPSGTAALMQGGTLLETVELSGGTATFSTAALSAGSHAFTFEYSGDVNFNAGTSQPYTQTVDLAPTTTTLASDPNPTQYGQVVTLTAQVSSAAGGPAGMVTFKEGTETLGTAQLNGAGQAALSLSSLTLGEHTLTAEYAGQGNFSGSASAEHTHTVGAASTTTALTSSPNPSQYGQGVTLTAQVSSSAGTVSGMAAFKDGETLLGYAPLVEGTASLTTSSLALGAHSLTAEYSGEGHFSGSASEIHAHQVNPASTSTALTSAPNPSHWGQAVVLTALVSSDGGVPTGTVTFKNGAETLGTSQLNGAGQASLTVATLPVGEHSLTAEYAGAGNFSGSSSPAHSHTVERAPVTVSLASAPNPSQFGQQAALTAQVSSPAGLPSGTVTFWKGALSLGTAALDAEGQAQILVPDLPVGDHNLTAEYAQSENFQGGLSAAHTHTVQKAAANVALVSSPNPSTYGQAVTLTAQVGSSGGVPTGTVAFKNGASVLGTGTLNASGQASLETSALPVGEHTLTAEYLGDSSFSGSLSDGHIHTVGMVNSTTSLTSSANPSSFGQSITLTAQVSGDLGIPTGKMTFKNGSSVLGEVDLDASGAASFSTASLSAGAHSLTAVYGGSESCTPSTSPVLVQIVTPAATALSLSSSINPSFFGQAVTLKADVTSAGGTPAGTVVFKNGAAALGSAALDAAGEAELTLATLPVGVHTLTAEYLAGGSFAGNISSPLEQTVQKAPTTVALTGAPDQPAWGTPVTLTAAVSSPYSTLPGSPPGTVTFMNGQQILATVALDAAGEAELTLSTLPVGSHSLTAAYGGSSSYQESTSQPLALEIAKAAASISLGISQNTAKPGEAVTLTALVSAAGGSPTGTVVFKDGDAVLGSAEVDASGRAVFTTDSLAEGVHYLTAEYGGSEVFSECASEPVSLAVQSGQRQLYLPVIRK